MKLYEIESEILNCIDPETGEILDLERLEALEMERAKKIEGVLCWIKNLESDADAIKAEKTALAEREKSARNKAERLRGWVAGVLDGQKFQTARAVVSWRKSEAVQISSMDYLYSVGDDYLTYKEPEPNKTKIKAALKAGVIVPGCYLEERNNMTIK